MPGRGRRTLAAVALAAGLFAPAGAAPDAAEGPSDGASHQSAGDFSAQLVLVADDQRLLQTWDAPPVTTRVASLRSVPIGGQAIAFVVFGGCTPDPSGHCDVTVRFRVHRPGGRPYAATPPMEVWQYKPAPPARTLQLSAQYLKVTVEPHDALGSYTVFAEVRDHVSNAAFQLSTTFEATR